MGIWYPLLFQVLYCILKLEDIRSSALAAGSDEGWLWERGRCLGLFPQFPKEAKYLPPLLFGTLIKILS